MAAWGFQQCERLIVAKEAVFLFWYWSLLEQFCIVSSHVWKERPKHRAMKLTFEMLSLWCGSAAWGCNTENDAERWSLCLQIVVFTDLSDCSCCGNIPGVPGRRVLAWLLLGSCSESAVIRNKKLNAWCGGSESNVCVCLYICMWFQNHCLWAETYLGNRMYKIPLRSSPSVDKPHFQAASQFELLRGKNELLPW